MTSYHDSNKILGIQYLRALAIVVTLFHHTVQYLIVHPVEAVNKIYSQFSFWSGVDLFFVISGFVIMKSFSESLSTNNTFKPTLYQFWIKRFFRILPAAWIWLLIYLFCTQFVNITGIFGGLSQNISDSKAAFLQYANIYGLKCWGAQKTMDCGPNGIYWSLSLEEQFYILLPLLVFFFRKNLKYLLIVGIVAQFFIFRPLWSVGWAIRSDSLAWGVLLAILYQSGYLKKLEPKFLTPQPLVSLFILLLSTLGLAYFAGRDGHVFFAAGLIAFISAFLVYTSSFEKPYLFPFEKVNKILLWLGSRSYSIYLAHIVVFCLAYEIIHQMTPADHRFSSADNLLLILTAYPLLFGISELNYRLIEKPFRDLGLKLSKKVKTT